MSLVDRARASFLRACELDVEVRKPGNVSRFSPGHGMQAEQFVASARAAAGPMFAHGARVGDRIEAAVNATWAVAGCNTNLGILLLCAPIARAIETLSGALCASALRESVESALAGLDLADARSAYRAIARATPGGLGSAPDEDVRQAPSVDLRAAMALAAHRDSIARQYRDGFADLFEVGLPALGSGFSLMNALAVQDAASHLAPAVQRLYLTCLARWPDSHIVRIHGEAVAHNVMAAAQRWLDRAATDGPLDEASGFSDWDASLKAQRINPGTSADLTVATLMLAGCLAPS
ncbi:triphosphoribosyl-dephospho-CoA synthase [Ideonella sp. A 288]|uniref:triphosphoribosyl-dephospho-CoA synthase n=1 Tax=Ideonella sp. A 288 TaxID=1962181 RepID=UPI000B4A890B|nr:triphosphoribosyl-dephospho-CoA synthase [Ideonella sp. A 288]